MPSRDDALELARKGWAVLPLRGKVPVTVHGVKDASRDLAQVAAWWPSGASWNVGARVPSSLVVLDVDPQNGGSLIALEHTAGVRLPATLTVHSGRGTGGQHRYYMHPGGPVSSTRLPAGIDVKTDRGYCVMPPSVHPATGRPYRWEQREPVALPYEVVALLRPPTPAALPSRSGAALPERALHLAHYVEQLGEGNRNAGLFWAACRALEEGQGQGVLDLLEGAAIAAGLDEREAARTVASARRTVRR
ncbi:MAG: bifunctional DNA primase/polymerase [Protaetiibacter sp.]